MRYLFILLVATFVARVSFLHGQSAPYQLDSVEVLAPQSASIGDYAGIFPYSTTTLFGVEAQREALYQLGNDGEIRVVEDLPVVPVIEVNDGYLVNRKDDDGRWSAYFLHELTLEFTHLFDGRLSVLGRLPAGGLVVGSKTKTYIYTSAKERPLEILDSGAEALEDAVLNDLILFFNAAGKLYRTDGTRDGTFSVSDLPAIPSHASCTFKKSQAFVVGQPDQSEATYGLLLTDGTPGNTTATPLKDYVTTRISGPVGRLFATARGVVVNIYSESAKSISTITTAGASLGPELSTVLSDTRVERPSQAYVTHAKLSDGTVVYDIPGFWGGLYRTDGTKEGTKRLIAYFQYFGGSSYADLEQVAVADNGTIYFTYRVNRGVERLYALTKAGELIAVSFQVTTSSCVKQLSPIVRHGSALYFAVNSTCAADNLLYRLPLGEVQPTKLPAVVLGLVSVPGGPVIARVDQKGKAALLVFNGLMVDTFLTEARTGGTLESQLVALQDNKLYFTAFDERDGEVIYRIDYRTGNYERVKSFGFTDIEDIGPTPGLLEQRGDKIYFSSPKWVFATSGKDPAEHLVIARDPVITHAANERVIIRDRQDNAYWLSDGTQAGTKELLLPKELRGLDFHAYQGQFHTLQPSADPLNPAWFKTLTLYSLTAVTGTLDSIELPLPRSYPLALNAAAKLVSHDDGLLYAAINTGSVGGSALLVTTDGSQNGTRVLQEVTANQTGFRISDLRSEAGVLRFEWVSTTGTSHVGLFYQYDLYDPVGKRVIRLFSGPNFYATTARIGEELFVHDSTRIYALCPTDLAPRVVFDYELATGRRSTPDRRYRVTNLTAHHDGTLLYHRGTSAYGVGRMYPGENYREEVIFAEANTSFFSYDRKPFAIIGDQLLTTVDDAPASNPVPYQLQLYDLRGKDGSVLSEQDFVIRYRLFLATGNDFYFVNERPAGRGSRLYVLSVAGRPSTSSGTVFEDFNTDGTRQHAEPGLENIRVIATASSETLYTFSDTSGRYSFNFIPDEDYVITPDSLKCYTPAGKIQPFTSSGDHAINLPDYGMRPVGTSGKLTAHLTSAPTRCGFTVGFSITVINEGCTPDRGNVSLLLPEGVVGPAGETTLTWPVPSVRPNSDYTILTELIMPSENRVGDTLAFSVVATNAVGITDTFVYHSEIRCAIDPNDKLVNPARTADNYTRYDEELKYTIRFQNTGNDTAFSVRLEDQLSAALDPASFRPVVASHPYQLQLSQDGQLKVYFDRILLPDSTTNERGSHGYFTFLVSLYPGNQPPKVSNVAAIFFDFNAPIITNLVTSTLVETLDADADGIFFWQDCDDNNPDRLISTKCKTVSTTAIDPIGRIELFPNPTEGPFSLRFSHARPTIITVFDPLGRTVLQTAVTGGGTIDLPRSAGIGRYIVRVADVATGQATHLAFIKF